MKVAEWYSTSGQYDNAKKLYIELINKLKSLRFENSDQMAFIRSNLGTIHVQLNEFKLAIKQYSQASELIKLQWGEQHDRYAFMLLQLGGAYLQNQQLLQAEKLNTSALDIARNNQFSYRFLLNMQMGFTKLALNDLSAAKTFFDIAEQQAIETVGKNNTSTASIIVGKALLASQQNNYSQSEQYWQQALAIFESQRQDFQNDSDRRAYLDSLKGVYDGLINLALKQNKPALAIETIARSKAKSLDDLLQSKHIKNNRSEEQKLVSELFTLKNRKALLDDTAAKDTNQRGLVRIKEYKTIDTNWHEKVKQLRNLNPSLINLVTSSPLKVADIQRNLVDDSIIIEYYQLEQKQPGKQDVSRWLVFTISKENIGWHELQLDASFKQQLLMFITDLQNSSSDLQQVKQKSQAIYQQLLSPIEHNLTAKNLIFIPHQFLNYLPFATLYNGKQFLLKNHNISSVSSSSIYLTLNKRKQRKLNDIVAFGDPMGSLGELAGARKEVNNLKSISNKTEMFIGKEASEQAFKNLAQPSLLHYAGHGVFNPEAPQMSYLDLTPSNNEDGKLQSHELYWLNLKETQLVVLSACESAQGKLSGGSEVIGLIRPFFYSGARNVLASLWNVDDDATYQLMNNFYQHYITEGQNERRSLRSAQLKMLGEQSKYQHPYYWAAFQLYGAG